MTLELDDKWLPMLLEHGKCAVIVNLIDGIASSKTGQKAALQAAYSFTIEDPQFYNSIMVHTPLGSVAKYCLV